jgi:peptide deformylase
MTILKIVTTPDPMLKVKSEFVDKIDASVQHLMDDMLESMYAAKGAGIAAVQVGILKRIFILDFGKEENGAVQDNPIFFINPEILYLSDEQQIYQEGCLSFPGGFCDMVRPKKVKIKYQDYYGKEQVMEADDWMSRGIQHEFDHVEGITMVDRMSRLKGEIFLKKVRKKIIEGE